MYTRDTDDILETNTPSVEQQVLDNNEGVEYYECQKCGEYNILRSTVKRRRSKRTRHIRLDDIAYASLKKYASINNVDLNYALTLLLFNARTSNISYLLHEKNLVKKEKNK